MEQHSATEPSFEEKTAINIRFQQLYDEGMRSGEHGHRETMFSAMHRAYAPYLASIDMAHRRGIAIGAALAREAQS